MQIVVGPVLRREDGYGYDLFVPESGLTKGPAYRRIEDAIYAQRVDSNRNGILCRTLDEFLNRLGRFGTVPA